MPKLDVMTEIAIESIVADLHQHNVILRPAMQSALEDYRIFDAAVDFRDALDKYSADS